MIRRLRYRLEYLFARSAMALFDSLPLPFSVRVAEYGADLYFLLGGMRRRTAIDNLLQAGLASTPAEARRIARESFRHFARLVIESFASLRWLTDDSWPSHCTLDLHPDSRRLLEDPRQGLLLISGHLGNWEVAAQVLSFLKPVLGIIRPMDNPHIDALMRWRTNRPGIKVISKREAHPAALLGALKQGHILALLTDQHASRDDTVLPFFGRPAYTHTSPALLHLITRTPIIFGYCERTGPCQYTLHVEEPLVFPPTGNRQADIVRVLSTLTGRLEAAIRRHPEQYLWGHRRWKKLRPMNGHPPTPGEPVAQPAGNAK